MNKVGLSSNIANSTGGSVKNSNQYVELKSAYSDFIRNVDKSDFANSPNRYIVEMRVVEELQSVASKFGKQEDVLFWTSRKQEIVSKLKEWGIELNT